MDEAKMATVELTAEIVSAYVGSRQLPVDQITELVRHVYAALNSLALAAAVPPPDAQAPAISIKKSIRPDFLICLEDGQKFKSLKRHLNTKYNMSPEAYRAKWSLPKDYPMVAPNYAASRSVLAKSMGLGGRAATGKGAAVMA